MWASRGHVWCLSKSPPSAAPLSAQLTAPAFSQELLSPQILSIPRLCSSSAVCWCGDTNDTAPEQLVLFPGALDHLS